MKVDKRCIFLNTHVGVFLCNFFRRWSILTIEITVLIAVISFVIGFLGHWQKSRSEAENKAREKAELSTKLDHIDVGVQDIRVQVRNTDHRLNEINDRVIRVEESSKSAHKRIDKMEEVNK